MSVPEARALDLLAVTGPAWVQDGGRPGRMHHGVPPGGALVPEALARANRAVGNPPDTAAIEAFGGLTLAARGGALAVTAGPDARVLAPDRVWVVPPPPPARVVYVAVHGGIAAPVVLGGRGLLVTAGFGGLFGRPLRAGDRLPVGPGADAITDAIADVGGGAPDAPRGAGPPDVPIRVVPGPDPERFAADAWDRLLAGAWRVAAASDRVGTRLEGTPLRRRDDDAGASAPMVHGAVQVPGGGEPIVLGPDHPTTGGYPVIAVVIAADRGALFARGPGAVVRFEAIDVAAARGARPRWGG